MAMVKGFYKFVDGNFGKRIAYRKGKSIQNIYLRKNKTVPILILK